MPQERIPFVPDQQSGWSTLGGGSPVAINVVVDGRGVVRRRPGIVSVGQLTYLTGSGGEGGGGATTNTTDVSGIYNTLDGSLYVVDGNEPSRRIYRRAPGGTTFADLSSGTTTTSTISPLAEQSLPGSGRPIFAETEAMLVIAGADNPRKVLFNPVGASPLGGSPPKASHIIANSSRLVANESDDSTGLRSQFFYSDQALGSSTTGHETWSGVNTGFITAEARPDKILALHESTNEVFVFGQETLQVYSPDALFVYAPLPTRNHGTAGAYGIVEVDQKFAWLDHRRRFVMSDGRSLDYIGEPIQRTMDDLTSVDDMFGYRVRLGFVDALVWTFPSDGRSFAYQIGGGWSQWMGGGSSVFERFIVNCLHIAPTTATNYVGLTSGRIGSLSLDTQYDLTDPIRAYVRTGFQDHGTDRRKHCTGVNVAIRRGEVTGSTAPIAWLRYRDDSSGSWQRIAIDVGASNDREIVAEYRSLGVYRRRQWEFEFSSTVELELVAVTEEFTVLDN